MNIDFTDEQKMLTDMVEKFTSRHYDVLKREAYIKDDKGFSSGNWDILAQTGLLSIPISEDNGGSGGCAADLISLMQPFGRAVAVEPILACSIFASHFLCAAASPAQKETWLPSLLGGSKKIAIAHSEYEARYDLEYVNTRYTQNGEHYELSGHKTFVLGAGDANAYIVSAIPHSAANGHGGAAETESSMRFFLVKASDKKLSQRPYRLTDGSVACELNLQGAQGELLEAGRFETFRRSVAYTKIGACAEMVGLAELLFNATVEYVKTREQFGRPLAKFQVIQHRLSDAYAKLELTRSHLLNLASLDPEDKRYHKTICGTKAYISKIALDIAEEAVQLHGGMGVSNEMLIGQALKRLLVLTTLLGNINTEMQSYA